MKNFIVHKAKTGLLFLLFGLLAQSGWGQTTVTIGGGASVTCPATPTATYTTPPTGVTFSNWSRGSGVTCGTASTALSGSGFNTASASASYTANKYFSVTITANATTTFTLSSIVWNTVISTGGGNFTVQYINNGGTLTTFGTAAQTGTTTNTFTGTVNVAAGTSIVLYLIPSGIGASGTTVRWVNGSTITVTASNVSPTLTAATLGSAISNTYGTASTGVSFTATGTNLTAANITATAQTGFAVSTDNSTFSSSVSVASGTLVYVRATATKAAGTFNGATAVVLTGGGAASSVNITTSASGNSVSAKALTITSAAATNKTYDRTTAATLTGSLSGVVNSDVVTLSGTGTFAQTSIGTGIAVTSTSTLGGAGAGNYTLTQPTGLTANITAKALTVSGATASNKSFDGSNTASISGGSLVGVISPDVVTLSQTGTFAQTTVGSGISVTSTSTIGGADSGNYTLTQPTGLSANITAKALTITGMMASDKTYDGNSTATLSGGSLVGVVSPDVVTLTQTGTFSQATVGSGLSVISTSTLGGANSGNYSLTQPTGITASITKATPIINTSPTASDIVLGQTLSASSLTSGSATPSGGTFTFTSPSTTPGATGPYLADITYTPLDATNYNTTTGTTNVTVNDATTPTLVAVVLSTNLTSTYGTASTGLSFSPTGISLTADITVTAQSGYEVSVAVDFGYGSSVVVASGATVYVRFSATKAAGNYNNAIFAVLTSDGASNVNASTTSSGNTVSQKALSISTATVASKTYDASSSTGTVTAGTLSDFVGAETVTVSSAVGTYLDANAGSGKSATIAYTLSDGTNGGLAANYSLANTSATGNISAKTLSITAASIASKTYDASATTGTVTAGTLSGFVGAETVTVSSAVGTYADANVGTGKTATIVYTLVNGTNNGLAANYSLANTSATGTITPKTLSITAASIASKAYDALATSGTVTAGTLSGFVGTETVVVASATGTYLNADVGIGKTATIVYMLSDGTNGGLATNYTLANTSTTGNITAKVLSVTAATIASKIYDGTTTAGAVTVGTLSGFVGTETVTATAAAAAYSSANVGTYSNVVITYTLANGLNGGLATNYSLATTTASGDITKANQTIAFSALANQTTATVVDYSPGATSSTSGTNPITYTSSNTAVATIVSSQIHIVGAGTTTITASQAASTNYNAAADVSQSLIVTLAPVTLATWNFTTNVSPASVPLNVTISNLAQGNNNGTTTILSATSASSGYSGASGTNNAGAAARAGVLSTGANGSAYFEFTITPTSGYYFSLKGISFGSRGTSTAPVAYVLRSSVDSYGSDLVTGSLSVNSTWGLYSNSTINSISSVGSAITYRIYGYNGSGSPSVNTANWRIDDLTLSGNVIVAATPPTLTADATANTVDNNIDITFTDDTAWRNAITAVKIGSTSLTLTTDYEISAGNIQLKPSGLNVLLTVSGSKSITVVATGYSDATVTQAINAGAPTSNSTATISSILAPNVTRTVTCTAKDQYSNLVSDYAFKYDATIVSADATTAESYTIDGSAITSSTNNVSLTSTTNASGVATFTVAMPAVLDANDGLSLQVQLADGSTNIGSAFAYYELPGQTITFGALSAVTYGDAAFTLSATGGASGNPVTFTSSDPTVATCTGTNGTTVTILKQGTTTIRANQAGSAGYNAAAQVDQLLTVNTKGLTITGLTGVSRAYNGTTTATFTGTPAYVGLAYGQSFSVSGTASAVFSDANVGIGKTITISGYTVPSANYTLTQPTLTADITQASQTISFGTLPNRVLGGASFTLPLNASSALAISYASSDTNVATVTGNTVTIIGVGTTTITASQAGNSNYAAATSVSKDQTIIATPIAGWDFFGQNNIASLAATTLNSNLTSGGITRGAGAAANSAANSFSTTGFQNDGISTANTDYFQITFTPSTGYQTSLSAINANFDGTAGFYAGTGVTSQYAYSLDGTNFTLIGSPVISTSLKPDAVDLTGISALQNVLPGNTITIRYYASGQTTSGGWRFYSPSSGVLGLAIGGSVDLIPTNNWTGTISTSWNNAGNWSLSSVPLSTDNITISTGSPILDVSHTIDAGRTLTLTSAGPFTINPNAILTITGTADFGGKSVIIKSDASGDGAIGQVTGTLSNATSVTVERYILEGNRAWRLLTAPLVGNGSSNTTIFNNWQNNGSVATGTGVELWGPGGTGAVGSIDSTTGLAYGPGGSIKQYGTGWSEITNTKTTDLFTTTANKAFGVFVTGHFGSGNISNGAATATTLRPTGQLIAGDVSFPISNTIHTLIGNPYASPISPSLILANTDNAAVLFPYLWVWDPKLNDFGGYVLYDNGFATYSGGSYSANTAIQSGQAFFVRTEAVTGNVLKLKESMKSGSITNTFRNSNSLAASIFRASFLKQTATDWMPLDGCIAGFYEGANAAADDADGKKMINTGENIGFVRNTINLSSEHYPLVTAQDILYLKVWNTQQAHYKLKLNTEEFTMVGVEAYLQDLYTGTSQSLHLDGSVQEYEFDVDPTVSASSGNRFRIVFTNTALSVTNPEQGQLSIYPNPVTGGKVTVSLPTGNFEGCSYELINVLGQVVRQDQIENGTTSQVSIPITGLPNSWYALRIRKDNKVVYQGKLIINN